MGSRSAPPTAVAIVVALACGALAALPSTAAAVTCDRVGAALIVALDSTDLAGLDASNGSIRVNGGSGQLIACSATLAPTLNNIGAILISNPPGASSGSVIIENAGDFAPGSIID